MKVSGVATRLREVERLLDRSMAQTDYWKVRALRAEGEDVPARPHPSASHSGTSTEEET